MTLYTLSAVALTSIFLAGGVGAASLDSPLSDPLVIAPSGIWQEVLPDGRSVAIFEPRDPGPCVDNGGIRPCVGGGDRVGSTEGLDSKGPDSVYWWIIQSGSGYYMGDPLGPCNNPGRVNPPFCDDPLVDNPVDPAGPDVPPVPLPGSVWALLLGIVTLFGIRKVV